MLRKQAKRILLVMLFVLTFVLAGRVDTNAQTAAPAGVKQVKAGSSSVTVQWDAVMQNDIYYYYRISNDSSFNSSKSERNYDESESYISGLSAGKSYYVQIGTSATYSGSTVPADVTWSKAIEVVTAPAQVASSSVKQSGAGTTSISLTWPASSGANCYKIDYYLNNASQGTASEVISQNNNVKITGLKKNNRYCGHVYAGRTSSTGFTAYAGSGSYYYDVKVKPTKITGVENTVFYSYINTAYIEWNPSNSASGYEYILYDNSGKKILSNTTTSKRLDISTNKIKKTQFYRIKVRGYVNLNNNKKAYGAWSDTLYFAKAPYKNLKLKSSGKKISANWNKVTGATSYTVYVSNKEKSGYKKVGTYNSKKTSVTIKKYGKAALKSGKTYYVKVVAEKKVKINKKYKTFKSTLYYEGKSIKVK